MLRRWQRLSWSVAVTIAAVAAVVVDAAFVQLSGAPGAQCATLGAYVAADGCSTCVCSVDGRMTFCSRERCPLPRGNYTINDCVEHAVYEGTDGCNRCQCGARRRFVWCTRAVCREAGEEAPVPTPAPAPRPPPPSADPPTAPTPCHPPAVVLLLGVWLPLPCASGAGTCVWGAPPSPSASPSPSVPPPPPHLLYALRQVLSAAPSPLTNFSQISTKPEAPTPYAGISVL